MPNMSIDNAYKNYCRSRFALPSEAQVRKRERKLSIDLPPNYRQFLLDYNGGYFTEPRILPPSKECPLDRLTFMHGIKASHSDAELGSDVDLFDDNDPPEILPIGYTIMGNLILLVTHHEDRGLVLLKKAFSDESYFLANGIEEFFGLLRDPPE